MSEFDPAKFSSNIEQNPLRKYFRQPKVYVTLPSRGKFYEEGVLDMPDNSELPVFAMTAKDELLIKTPDALLNGQATVDVIQSCMPNIKNAWQMPSVDLDACLVAIRIATYGESLDITTKVPGIGEERDFAVDLRTVLSKIVTPEFDNMLVINDINIELRPLTYKEFTESNLKTFEEQRIFTLVNDDEMDDAEKLGRFSASFKKLTNITVNMMVKSIAKLQIGDTEVTNRVHIEEFIDNVDKEFFKGITDHLETQREKFAIEPIKVQSNEEDIAAGAPETYEIPITFDQSNFFGYTNITVNMMVKSIAKLQIGDTEVTNRVHIEEFIDNVDKEFFKGITDHLETQREKFAIEPIKVQSNEEDIAAGAPETYEIPITFDQSNFFG